MRWRIQANPGLVAAFQNRLHIFRPAITITDEHERTDHKPDLMVQEGSR